MKTGKSFPQNWNSHRKFEREKLDFSDDWKFGNVVGKICFSFSSKHFLFPAIIRPFDPFLSLHSTGGRNRFQLVERALQCCKDVAGNGTRKYIKRRAVHRTFAVHGKRKIFAGKSERYSREKKSSSRKVLMCFHCCKIMAYDISPDGVSAQSFNLHVRWKCADTPIKWSAPFRVHSY